MIAVERVLRSAEAGPREPRMAKVKAIRHLMDKAQKMILSQRLEPAGRGEASQQAYLQKANRELIRMEVEVKTNPNPGPEL